MNIKLQDLTSEDYLTIAISGDAVAKLFKSADGKEVFLTIQRNGQDRMVLRFVDNGNFSYDPTPP